MTEADVKRFLALLQAGLWKMPVDAGLFRGAHVDWAGLFRLSKEQAVAGIVFDGIGALPEDCRPPQEIALEWYVFVLRIEQANRQADAVLASLLSWHAGQGIRPVLLKGRGLARLYPCPDRRQCGDIDLFLGQDYGKAKALLPRMQGIRMDAEGEKHLSCRYQGVEVEIHRRAACFYHPLYNRRLQVWVKQYLPGKAVRMALGGVEVQCPPGQFNAVYLLVHILLHFISDGVALRQIMDWAIVLRECADEIDTGRLLHELRCLGIEDAYKVFGYIAVCYLGLPSTYVHASLEEVAGRGDVFFADILEGGNWGQKRSAQGHGGRSWKKAWRNYLRIKERCGRMDGFCPALVRWYPYCRALNFMVKKLKGLD